jgi:RNA polymerase sigma-70 factor, ECF subfamily
MEENDSHDRTVRLDRRGPVRDLHAELIALLPRLRRFARALARDAQDADDLLQLALERALARAGQLQSDAPLAGWMYGIVRNAWIDEVRARGRRGRLFAAAAAAEDVADPSQDAQAEKLSVHDALARLPEEQRSAVALVLVEGLSYKEAAHVLEVPVGTLTSRLARARQALQAMLGDS